MINALFKTRESEIEKEFRNQCIGAGAWVIKMRLLGMAGFPDRVVLWKGGIIHFIELKRPGKKPRPSQKRMIARLVRYGFQVWVISTFHQITEYLEEHEEELKRTKDELGC